jgi:hypothetical protein
VPRRNELLTDITTEFPCLCLRQADNRGKLAAISLRFLCVLGVLYAVKMLPIRNRRNAEHAEEEQRRVSKKSQRHSGAEPQPIEIAAWTLGSLPSGGAMFIDHGRTKLRTPLGAPCLSRHNKSSFS